MKQKEMVLIKTLTSEGKSSLDMELLIELFRLFLVIWNPNLNFFKDRLKKKKKENNKQTVETKLILLFVGAFQVFIFAVLLI